MKKIIPAQKIALFALCISAILLITHSCQKQNSESKTEPEVKVSNEVRVVNGTLVFQDHTAFSNALKEKNKLSDKEKDVWEAAIGFTSFRKKIAEVGNAYFDAKNQAEADAVLLRHKEIVSLDNGELKPAIADMRLATLLDAKGIVIIGKDYYRFWGTTETIVLNGSAEKVISASRDDSQIMNGSNMFRFNLKGTSSGGTANRSTCTVGIMSECTSFGDKRKGFHRLEFSYYATIMRDPTTLLPIGWRREAFVNLHFSAQKKGLFGWNSYSTSYECNLLQYVDNAGHNVNLNFLSSNGDYSDWYYNLSFERIDSPYGPYPGDLCSPDITTFVCSAATRGTWPNYCQFTY
jgi:hypothetical protein